MTILITVELDAPAGQQGQLQQHLWRSGSTTIPGRSCHRQVPC